jgi:V-type H+-transporting ATPase subunit G
MKSQELIQQLLKAEQQADQIISKARENRSAKLKDAKTSAEDELNIFRSQEESKFAQDSKGNAAADAGTELAKVTAKELLMVKQDYQNNSNKCVEYILGKVLEVPLEINSAAKSAIIRGVM